MGPSDVGARMAATVELSGPNLMSKTVSIGETQPVQPARFAVISQPRLVGNPNVVGGVLSAVGGSWEPYPYDVRYQWRRDGAKLIGQTSSRYTTTSADLGRRLTVAVTVTAPGFTPVEEVLEAVPLTLTRTPTPTIRYTGRLATDTTLTVKPGTWDDGVTLAYQWRRNGANIPGATATSYRLTASDVGDKIGVLVTGTKPEYPTVATLSAAVTPRNAVFTTLPPPSAEPAPSARPSPPRRHGRPGRP